MKKAVILCNGEFPRKEYPLYLLREADVIVCCDSSRNLSRLKRLGLEPAMIVGDMDSTPAKLQQEYAKRIVRVEEQDDNDLAKAFRLLRERYPEVCEIHILGAGGKNEAHTVGNLGWLMEWERRAIAEGTCLEARGLKIDMVSDYSTAFTLSGLEGCGAEALCNTDRTKELPPVELHVGEGRKVSFFSTDSTLRIQSEGLAWPLEGVDLSLWWVATLNRAEADTLSLRFSHAAPLLVILD